MKLVLLLAKTDIRLAREEVNALLNPRKSVLEGDLLIIDVDSKRVELAKRLAYTKAVYRLLFSCSKAELVRTVKEFSWQEIYEKSFSLRVWKNRKIEKELAGYIWWKLKKPRVNLKNAGTKIEIFEKDKVHCCLLIHKQEYDYGKRKPHLRPGFSPVSLDPRLARCMVNLTGIEKGIIVDVFCGTGGLLIEAGLMGLKAKGYDIDSEMLVMSEDNLRHFGVEDFKLEKKNAMMMGDVKYLVSDLPYGKNTKKVNLEKLYSRFFAVLEKKLKKRAVIGMPSFISHKRLVGKLKVVKEFKYYLHKSLSKKILILE